MQIFGKTAELQIIEKTFEGTGMLEKENVKKRKVKKGKNSK